MAANRDGDRRYSGGAFCAAINCFNCRAKTLQISFFKFPRDVERCKRWVVNSRRKDLRGKEPELHNKGYVLCATHFETGQFMNAVDRKRLIWNAVPTIFDVPNPPPRITCKRPLPTRRAVEPDPKQSLLVKLSKKEHTALLALGAGKNAFFEDQQPGSSKPDDNEQVTGNLINHERPKASLATKIPKVSVNKLLDEIMDLRRQLHQRRLPTLCARTSVDVRRQLHRYQTQLSRLRKKLSNVQTTSTKRNKMQDIQDIIQRSSNYLPEKCHALFAAQLKHSLLKKKTGSRWAQVEKDFAVSLHGINRKAYSFCSGYLLLPVSKTVNKWTSAQMDTQLNSIERIVQNVPNDLSIDNSIEPLNVCIATIDSAISSDTAVETGACSES